MSIWSAEIKELERLYESFKGQLPELEKELGQLIQFDDPNVILLYSRRCLEVIITDLCECELMRDRGTEPLKGIIDKLHKEKTVPAHIITSMHGLNDLSTYGTHPKDFDPAQVKPVLNNLDIIIRWYLGYKCLADEITVQTTEEFVPEIKTTPGGEKKTLIQKKKTFLISSGIFLLALIIITVLYFTDILGGSRLAKGLEKSLAVLPFRNDTPVDSNKYFINGVMEDILNDLQKIKALRVISRTSVEKYRNTTKSIPEIARELGVNYIVEGSGQKSGKIIRLSVQLLRASKEDHLWGNSYEKELHETKDIFNIQRQIANSITSELNAIMTPQEKQIIEKIPTLNLDAYESVLKGKFYMNKITKDDLDTAMKYFEMAKEEDPQYAPAYHGISAVWEYRRQAGMVSPEEAFLKIKGALMKAVELDSTICLGAFYTWTMWEWEKGEKEFKKAIELNPNDADARRGYSHLLIILGRNEEAIEQIEIAVKLDPVNAFTLTWYGVVLTFAHKYEEAIKAFQDALKIEPNYPFVQGNLGMTFALSGKYKEAVEQWELSCGNDTELVNAYKKGYLEGGFRGANISYNKVVEERYKNSYWNPTDIAAGYIFTGEKNKALYWFEEGYKVHDPNMPYQILHPVFDNLHDDPRFQEIARKMKLPYK